MWNTVCREGDVSFGLSARFDLIDSLLDFVGDGGDEVGVVVENADFFDLRCLFAQRFAGPFNVFQVLPAA